MHVARLCAGARHRRAPTARLSVSPAPSLRDVTRVAASSAELWRDIFLANAGAVDAAIGAFARRAGAPARRDRGRRRGGAAARCSTAARAARLRAARRRGVRRPSARSARCARPPDAAVARAGLEVHHQPRRCCWRRWPTARSVLDGALFSDDTRYMARRCARSASRCRPTKAAARLARRRLRRRLAGGRGRSLRRQRRHGDALSGGRALSGARPLSHRRQRAHARAADPGSGRRAGAARRRRDVRARHAVPAGAGERRRPARRRDASWRRRAAASSSRRCLQVAPYAARDVTIARARRR